MPDFYRLDAETALSELKTDPKRGLSEDEITRRRADVGANSLPVGEEVSVFALILAQFKNIMVIILIVAAVISFFLGDLKDVLVILAIVIANALLGAYQEFRAEQALAALGAMQVPQVRVRRDGEVGTASANDLVPGDIVLLGEGDRVPADGRLIIVANLQIEEAALTGESQAVEKIVDPIAGTGSVALGDRLNMAFMGTSITYGRGEMLVTGTGLKTEIGKIASLLMGVEESQTPLQRRLDQLSLTLVRAAIVVVVIVFIVGVLRGNAVEEMLITSISLAVAAVPEGLPAVITISLSLGAARMVNRNALIRRLPAVETLGSVTVICSDKTGTLTKNQMTATLFSLPGHDDVKVTGVGYSPTGEFISTQDDGTDKTPIDPMTDPSLGRFLKAMALATDAHLNTKDDGTVEVVGDTTEGALVVAAQKVGWTREMLEQSMPRVAELPFSSERKAMSTVHTVAAADIRAQFGGATTIMITKGAPDRLIEWASQEHVPDGARPLSDARRAIWQKEVDELASKGLRILGVAYRPLESVPKSMKPEDERNLILLGLIGILDPARPEARLAVQTAREAGIRAIMITGDHALTAGAIATDLGIINQGDRVMTGADLDAMNETELDALVRRTNAFARVSPEHKMRLVQVLQKQGQIVAMTGDGVNDAPALKQADIGVAMGITGTEVSKGASDMVLTDDNFASIVAAVEEGRTIYDNLRKFVLFLLSSNIGEILVMFVGILIGLPIPMLAIQILWINLVTDGLPAIALGFEPSEPGTMKRPPRSKDESIFAQGVGRKIVVRSILLATLTLIAFVIGFAWHKLDPFNPTLNLEALDRSALASVVGVDMAPEDWDTLTVEERRALLMNATTSEGAPAGEGEGSNNELVGAAERIPRTIAFTVLALGQLFHVLAIHAGDTRSFFQVGFTSNQFLLFAVVLTLLLQLAVIYLPFMQTIFETYPIGIVELALSVLIASLVLVAIEIEKLVMRPRGVAAAAA
ncbi:MAG: cation-translocating P-type ATPase [Chloroflexota bacterium]|nr:cation-translocating P-type ATPase [Chloroflexota bacterium]